jgi:hypothetical protein
MLVGLWAETDNIPYVSSSPVKEFNKIRDKGKIVSAW